MSANIIVKSYAYCLFKTYIVYFLGKSWEDNISINPMGDFIAVHAIVLALTFCTIMILIGLPPSVA